VLLPRPGRSFFWKSIHVSCAATGWAPKSRLQVARIARSRVAGARAVNLEGGLVAIWGYI
jgi:hypothetical protein